MIGSSLYSKLKHIFPQGLENIQFSEMGSDCIDQSQTLSFLISSTLPHLPIDQIHTLCKGQQKNVIDKIMEVKQFDIYEEIAKACPSQRDLKTIPTDEVVTRINQYSCNMASQQKMVDTSDDEEMMDYSDFDSAIMDESPEQMLQPMQIHQMHYQSINSIKGLNNIFEEEYNLHSHLPWNEMYIYDLN